MADTKVSYTVKILGSKEDYDLMYAIFRKMKLLSGFCGELIRTKSDEARQTFEINEDFGRTDAMLIILKVGLLLDRYQRKCISFKVFGVEDNDYGTVIPFLIDGTGQTPTYREMFVGLCDEMEGFDEFESFDSEEEGVEDTFEDDFEDESPFSDICMCFDDEGMEEIERFLKESKAKVQPLNSAEPLHYLVKPLNVQLAEFIASANQFSELFG